VKRKENVGEKEFPLDLRVLSRDKINRQSPREAALAVRFVATSDDGFYFSPHLSHRGKSAYEASAHQREDNYSDKKGCVQESPSGLGLQFIHDV
jgi:hypothetical protein